MNNMNIQIIEKPDWVSWEEIHDVLIASHTENRSRGIVMSNPMKPAEDIKQLFQSNGKMFVAIVNEKIVGTAGVIIKEFNLWCDKVNNQYADCILDSVLPEYNGRGLFKALDIKREEYARSIGVYKMIGDTHELNTHRLSISKKTGYKNVAYKVCADHFNIVFVKWLNGCPWSDRYVNFKFQISKFRARLLYKMDPVKGRQETFFLKFIHTIKM